MHPDGYPATTWIEWGTIPVLYPLKPSVVRVEQIHSGAAPREKENVWLRFPFLLSIAARVRSLGYYYPRIRLPRDWKLWIVWPSMIKWWAIDPHDCAIIFLGEHRTGVESTEGPRLTTTATMPWTGCGISSKRGCTCALSVKMGSAE